MWTWMDIAILVIFFLCSLIFAIQNIALYFSPTTGGRTPRTRHEKTNRKFGGSNRTERSAVFSTFDRDGDGFITKQELAELLRGSGMDMSDEDISDEFEKVDSNGDGLIDFEEFCGIYESKETRGEEDQELREAFDVFDRNGDGLITAEELGLMLSSLGMKEAGNSLIKCREMIKSVDRDGDGMVNFEEFKRMMIAKSGPGIVLPPT